jgi:predicted KAP-like P-loop ATPase
MSTSPNFDDLPITTPDQDLFGFDAFARMIAHSISNLQASSGVVLAINGPWGSGKSSVVNLVRYHLEHSFNNYSLKPVQFECWWFRGEEALTVAFFQELYTSLGPSLGRRFKKAIRRFGKRVMKAGAAAGAGVEFAGATGAGAIVSGTMDWLSGLVGTESVEDLYLELKRSLKTQNKRFLVIIDDIDRLMPDEAIQMFRLVKSVGRLPNVIYLLVFDRGLAEATITNSYPSEGPHFLEKIVQASFDVPELSPPELVQQLLSNIASLVGGLKKIDSVDFMNIFYDIVTPSVLRPRDLVKLTNVLSITIPTIGKDVYLADHVAIESIRLNHPTLFRAIRESKDLVCPTANLLQNADKVRVAERLDVAILSKVSEPVRQEWRSRLMRLFPRLEQFWGNLYHGAEIEGDWNRDRRICSRDHFDTYFRFSLPAEVLGQDEIDELISNAGDEFFLKAKLLDGLAAQRANGMTKASLVLDVLTQNADAIPPNSFIPALRTVFSLADTLDVEADRARGFSIGSNELRIHWFLRRLLLERTDLSGRSEILMEACKSAAVGWLVNLYRSAHDDYFPREGRLPEAEENCLLTKGDTERLGTFALSQLRAASQDGRFLDHNSLAFLMFNWEDLASREEVREWASEKLDDNAWVISFARAFTHYSWSQGMGMFGQGDLVAKRTARVSLESLRQFFEVEELRARVQEILDSREISENQRATLGEFLEAWDRADKKEDVW